MSAEQVVLLTESGDPCGVADKDEVHSTTTPLHLAFSCHLLNGNGEVLVTRRSLAKRAWPGVWTNAFCGHPAPGERPRDALHRRARLELGAEVDAVGELLPDFRYRAVDDGGIVENEFCPVFRARLVGELIPNEREVIAQRWVDPAALALSILATPWAFSPWLVQQVEELEARGGYALALGRAGDSAS